MREQLAFGLGGMLLYSILNALLPKITAIVSAQVAVAIYVSCMSVVAWATVFLTGQLGQAKNISQENLLALIALGILAFVADFAWFKAFKAEGNPVVLFALISGMSFSATIIFSVVNGTSLNWKEITGVLLCSLGVYMVQTART